MDIWRWLPAPSLARACGAGPAERGLRSRHPLTEKCISLGIRASLAVFIDNERDDEDKKSVPDIYDDGRYRE
jgi:hypothetical protein